MEMSSPRRLAARRGGRYPRRASNICSTKERILAALAVHAFDIYLAERHNLAHTDHPVDDMRRGWTSTSSSACATSPSTC